MQLNNLKIIIKMETKLSFNFYAPKHVLFGAGELFNLNKNPMPGTKALVVISNGKSTKDNGYLARVEKQLKDVGIDYVVFDRIEPNPLRTTVMAGAAARENRCDFVVALGGGSVIDASKAIALMTTNPGYLWDYMLGGTGKRQTFTEKSIPIIVITTTAGTGSEIDRWGVITNAETNEKMSFGMEDTFLVISIVDPELMISVPSDFTAYQGFDALFHSVEAYITKPANLMSDMITLTAIENVGRNLARAVKDGNDIEARTLVAFGNTLSGYAMEVGMTSSQHSLENTLTGFYPALPHGAGLIILSKAYFTFLINKHIADERFVRMAQAMSMEDARVPMDFITALEKLQEDCGVAGLKLSDYGVNPDEFHKIAVTAMDINGGLFGVDGYQLTVDDCVEIYNTAYIINYLLLFAEDAYLLLIPLFLNFYPY